MRTLFTILLFFVHATFAQSLDGDQKAYGQVEYRRPTVYLDYVCSDSKVVHVRMFNNTVWTLAVTADDLYYKTGKRVQLLNGAEFYVLPTLQPVSLQYRVDRFAEQSKIVKVPDHRTTHTSFTNWIASQDSFVFLVPKEYLDNDLKILVSFNYEWEVSKTGAIVSGPEHRVTFRGIDLPSKTRVCPK
jgi:hypothetical protein